MPPGSVRQIYRVENRALQSVHEACRLRLEKERPEKGANMRHLFHATTRAAAGAIVREGFDAHRAGQAHGAALGPGIYVATRASFSHGYSSEDSGGMRAMFLCSVLLGEPERNSRSSGGEQFVVYRECQVLPSFLIMYMA
jgi:poly [ADP-ribose] polymerase 7/11/12/13